MPRACACRCASRGPQADVACRVLSLPHTAHCGKPDYAGSDPNCYPMAAAKKAPKPVAPVVTETVVTKVVEVRAVPRALREGVAVFTDE